MILDMFLKENEWIFKAPLEYRNGQLLSHAFYPMKWKDIPDEERPKTGQMFVMVSDYNAKTKETMWVVCSREENNSEDKVVISPHGFFYMSGLAELFAEAFVEKCRELFLKDV